MRPALDEPPAQHPTQPALYDPERSLLGEFDDYPIGVDVLSAGTGLTASQATAALSVQELKRLVRRLPGHQFVRT